MNAIRKAVIPAAGFGTRFLPATKSIPKEMVPVLDRPAIQWIVEEAVDAGVQEVIIVTSKSKPALCEHFTPRPELEAQLKNKPERLASLQHLNDLGRRVRFVYQEEQRGLGHAVLCAEKAVGGDPFLVLLGDALVRSCVSCSRQLVAAWKRAGEHSVIGLQEVPRGRVHRYGIVAGRRIDRQLLQLDDLIEKPSPEQTPSCLAIAGRYLLTPGIFDALHRTPPGRGQEIQLTDAVRRLTQSEPVFGCVYEGVRHDIGNPLDYLTTLVAYGLDHPDYRTQLQDCFSARRDAYSPKAN